MVSERPQSRDNQSDLTLTSADPAGEAIATKVATPADPEAPTVDAVYARQEPHSVVTAPASEPPPFARIGPYRIERELGHGGMGSVYLAQRDDDELAMTVAVKLIRPGIAKPAMVELFRNERQLLADLKHPHIGMLLDAGTTKDGQPYFIMEYIEGRDIAGWCLSRQAALPQLLRLFTKVVEAVAFAHRKGVIHRDIKPANLMVNEDGEPKLLDFGTLRK